jgi:hypothetical protein
VRKWSLFVVLLTAASARAEGLLSLVKGLPTHEVCEEQYYNAYQHRHTTLPNFFHRNKVPVCLREWLKAKAEWRLQVWTCAQWATKPDLEPEARCEAVRQLISVAGWRAVLTGELPSPVPLGWYKERRWTPKN